MSLSRHTSKIYMDSYDLDGVLKVLDERVDEFGGTDRERFYKGALMALSLIRNHEEIRDQSIFIQMLEVLINESGLR